MEKIRTSLARRGSSAPPTAASSAASAPASGVGSASRRGSPGCSSCVTLVAIPGSQLLIYPVLWLLMPADDSVVATAHAPYATR